METDDLRHPRVAHPLIEPAAEPPQRLRGAMVVAMDPPGDLILWTHHSDFEV